MESWGKAARLSGMDEVKWAMLFFQTVSFYGAVRLMSTVFTRPFLRDYAPLKELKAEIV